MRIVETLKRIKPSRTQLVSGALILSAGALAYATPLNVFNNGDQISAGTMNANFQALDTNPSISGNLTLVLDSTATTGNIMKGTNAFLHNYGTNNTFLGVNAGNFTMTGFNNMASGENALIRNTTGSDNTANGMNALAYNTTGSVNTASGAGALFQNTTGTDNTAIGQDALQANTTGTSNTAVGRLALYAKTIGTSNTAIGHSALRDVQGSDNIAIGVNAGLNLSGASVTNGNILIGSWGAAGESSTIRIGAVPSLAQFGQIRAFIAGIRGVTTGNLNAINVVVDSNGQLGTISSSQRTKDDIADMGTASDVLMKLRPVTFHYKSDKNPKGRTLQYGLVAEEVSKVAPTLAAHNAKGEIETVYYQHLAPMLLNEYQKQARELAELKQQLANVTATLARIQQLERVASARDMGSR